jgi:transcriptional regulator with XRE-family HTH domain
MNDLHEKIGERVKKARHAVGLTQAELSESTGLGVETISRIERGVQGVTFENIAKIADGLEMGFGTLCDIETTSNRETNQNAQIAQINRMLEASTPHEVALVYDFVDSLRRRREEFS